MDRTMRDVLIGFLVLAAWGCTVDRNGYGPVDKNILDGNPGGNGLARGVGGAGANNCNGTSAAVDGDGCCLPGMTVEDDLDCAIRWTYEAEQSSPLRHFVGFADSDAWAVDPADPRSRGAGLLSGGPYATDWGVGARQASIRAQIDNNSADDAAVLVLEIFDTTMMTIIQVRTITRKQFTSTATYQDFVLPFVISKAEIKHQFEARIQWTGTGKVKVDRIAVEEQRLPTLTVCASGTAGQTGCDYIGGDGIQQAVDAASSDVSVMTKIRIKAGEYTRSTFTDVSSQDNMGVHKQKAFVYTRGKNIHFVGEDGAVLSGARSAPMTGIYSDSASTVVEHLTFGGFRRDPADCYATDSIVACSRGRALIADGNAKITVIASSFYLNNDAAASGFGASDSRFYNNLFFNGDGDAITQAQSSNGVVVNNTLYAMRGVGIRADKCKSDNPALRILNNIMTGTMKDLGRYGFAIGAACLHDPGKLTNVKVEYNLFFANAGDHTDCNKNELCDPPNTIQNRDPQYVDPANASLKLLANSPASHQGVPEIKDPDGQRSTMGAYGGPAACMLDATLPGC